MFKDLLTEHSLWADDIEKNKLLSKKVNYATIFWINYIGILALFQKYGKHPKIIQYLKENPLNPKNIKDIESVNDLMAIIKLVDDNTQIKDEIFKKMTMLLVKIRSGKIDKLDENIIRDDIIKKIKKSAIWPYKPVERIIWKEFLPGNINLIDTLPVLYDSAIKKKTCLEFRKLYKQLDSTVTIDVTVDNTVTSNTSSTIIQKVLSGTQDINTITSDTTQNKDNTVVVNNITWNDILNYFTAESLKNNEYIRMMFYAYCNDNGKNIQNEAKEYLPNYIINEDEIIKFICLTDYSFIDKKYPNFSKLSNSISYDLSKVNSNLINPVNQLAYNNPLILLLFCYYDIESYHFDKLRDGIFKIDEYSEDFQKLFKSVVYGRLKDWWLNNLIEKIGIFSYRFIFDYFIKNKDFDVLHKLTTLTDHDLNIFLNNFYSSGNESEKLFEGLTEELKFKYFSYFISIPDLKYQLKDYIFSVIKLNDLINKTPDMTYEKILNLIFKFKDSTLTIDIEWLKKTEYYDNFNAFKTLLTKHSLSIEGFVDYLVEKNIVLHYFNFNKSSSIETVDNINSLCIKKIIDTDKKNIPKYFIDNISRNLLESEYINNIIQYLENNNYTFEISYIFERIINFSYSSEMHLNKNSFSILLKVYVNSFSNVGYISFYNVGYIYKIVLNNPKIIDKKLLIDEILLRDYAAGKALFDKKAFIIFIRDEAKEHKEFITTFIDHIMNIDNINNKDVLIIIHEELKEKIKINFRGYILHISILYNWDFIDDKFLDSILDSTEKICYLTSYINSRSTDYDIDFEKLKEYLKNLKFSAQELIDLDDKESFISTFNEYLFNSFLENTSFKSDDDLVKFLNYIFTKINLKGFYKAELINMYNIIIGKIDINNLNLLDNVIDNISNNLNTEKNKIINDFKQGLINNKFYSKIIEKMYSDNNPLKPGISIDKVRVQKLFKFNKFKIPTIRKKKNESFSELLTRTIDVIESLELPNIKLKKINDTQEDLEKRTIELSKYNTNRHGDTAVEFLESFDYDYKYPEADEFDKRFGTDNIIKAFSGTGLVAANFIIKFGFTVIPSNDESTVGRMLDIKNLHMVKPKLLGDELKYNPNDDSNSYINLISDGYFPVIKADYESYDNSLYHKAIINRVGGVYFSDALDKCAQYVSDSGYSRRKGAPGVMIELEANLGKKALHYESAGLGNDSIRSPEYAVCWPRAQLRIKRIHKVKIVSIAKIKKLKEKYNI